MLSVIIPWLYYGSVGPIEIHYKPDKDFEIKFHNSGVSRSGPIKVSSLCFDGSETYWDNDISFLVLGDEPVSWLPNICKGHDVVAIHLEVFGWDGIKPQDLNEK